MMRFTRAVPLAALVAAPLISAACRSNPPEPVTTAPTVNQDSINRENARRDSIARAEAARRAEAERMEAARRDSINRANAAAAAAANAAAELRNSILAEIHFNFDASEILEGDRTLLDRKASILNANSDVRIRIAGHADERGSDEYNMALGQRRAAAAKRYLESRGVASNRIEIVSFGEERGKCDSHDEGCWAQNRRGEFEIIAGGTNLMAPRP